MRTAQKTPITTPDIAPPDKWGGEELLLATGVLDIVTMGVVIEDVEAVVIADVATDVAEVRIAVEIVTEAVSSLGIILTP